MGDMVGARRDWSYLQDIVDAYVLLAEKGEKGSTYVIGSGKSYSIGEFILTDLVSVRIYQLRRL